MAKESIFNRPMNRRDALRVGATAAGILVVSGCSPLDVSLVERTFGLNLNQQDRDSAQALPDKGIIRLPDGSRKAWLGDGAWHELEEYPKPEPTTPFTEPGDNRPTFEHAQMAINEAFTPMLKAGLEPELWPQVEKLLWREGHFDFGLVVQDRDDRSVTDAQFNFKAGQRFGENVLNGYNIVAQREGWQQMDMKFEPQFGFHIPNIDTREKQMGLLNYYLHGGPNSGNEGANYNPDKRSWRPWTTMRGEATQLG